MIQVTIFQCSILFLLASSYVNGNDVSSCGGKEASSYLDVAVDMIEKAKSNISNIPPCSNNEVNFTGAAVDCADILLMGHNSSGVYTVRPMNRVTEGKAITVFCDMDTNGGGWTLIQRRGDFQRPKDYFFKDWKSYKEGFGDVEKDFWLGNDNIFALTNQKQYSVRIDLKDVDGNRRHALYDSFWIDDEDHKYTLHIADYSGYAGDSLIAHHNSNKFSTKDQDNDNHKVDNCAMKYKGGWWYNACHHSNLNGLYLKGKHESYADGIGWVTWKGHQESMESTEIKIRPKTFRPLYISTPLR